MKLCAGAEGEKDKGRKRKVGLGIAVVHRKRLSRQRSKVKKHRVVKNPGKVRARTCGTKSPSRSEALRFIGSAKFPFPFGVVDLSLDISRVFFTAWCF